MNSDFVKSMKKVFSSLNTRIEKIANPDKVSGKRPIDYNNTENELDTLNKHSREYTKIQKANERKFESIFKAVDINKENIDALRNIVFHSMDRTAETIDTVSRENMQAQELEQLNIMYDTDTERFHSTAEGDNYTMIAEKDVKQRIADLRNAEIIDKPEVDAEPIPVNDSGNSILDKINQNLILIGSMLDNLLKGMKQKDEKPKDADKEPEKEKKPFFTRKEKDGQKEGPSSILQAIGTIVGAFAITHLADFIKVLRGYEGGMSKFLDDVSIAVQDLMFSAYDKVKAAFSEIANNWWEAKSKELSDSWAVLKNDVLGINIESEATKEADTAAKASLSRELTLQGEVQQLGIGSNIGSMSDEDFQKMLEKGRGGIFGFGGKNFTDAEKERATQLRAEIQAAQVQKEQSTERRDSLTSIDDMVDDYKSFLKDEHGVEGATHEIQEGGIPGGEVVVKFRHPRGNMIEQRFGVKASQSKGYLIATDEQKKKFENKNQGADLLGGFQTQEVESQGSLFDKASSWLGSKADGLISQPETGTGAGQTLNQESSERASSESSFSGKLASLISQPQQTSRDKPIPERNKSDLPFVDPYGSSLSNLSDQVYGP